MNRLSLAAAPSFDSIDVGFLVCVSVFAAILIGTLIGLHRWRDREARFDARRRDARGSNFVTDAERDVSYQRPASQQPPADQKPSEEPPPAEPRQPPPLKQPRPLMSCPRCEQVVLGEAAPHGQRMVCPTCGCKFYPPRPAI